MKRARSVGAVLALLAVFATGTVQACGHCVEDRIAAVYDHALVQRTVASGHRMAYFAWEGALSGGSARRELLAQVEAVPGIDKGSARVSMDPAAIAIAFDPRRGDAVSVGAALQARLRRLKLSVVPLQAGQP
jgi:hypothetical protein